MADVKVIELKGIVHNSTKIGVVDGQAEDIVNLRFKDGAWRATGDGRFVLSVGGYNQLFIHTNVYRHLLGMRDGKLWWIATADAEDPNNFIKKSKAVSICSCTSNTNIVQNGNLITIYDGENKFFKYALYLSSLDSYKVLNADTNGERTDIGTFPFGNVHFGYVAPDDTDHKFLIEEPSKPFRYDFSPTQYYLQIPTSLAHDNMIRAFDMAQKKNRFTRPILACVAVRLYDGTYAFASAPQLVYPRQKMSQRKYYFDGGSTQKVPAGYDLTYFKRELFRIEKTTLELVDSSVKSDDIFEFPSGVAACYENGCVCSWTVGGTTVSDDKYTTSVMSADLVLDIKDIEVLKANKDIFTDVCVFITPEIDFCYMGVEDYKKAWHYNGESDSGKDYTIIPHIKIDDGNRDFYSYFPTVRDDDDILYDLRHSQFYLLRSYTSSEFSLFKDAITIDLTDREYEGVLSNIVQQDRLPVDAFNHSSFIPKYVYQYNGRNHYANYTNMQFHGFPIYDFMHNGVSLDSMPDSSFHGLFAGFREVNKEFYQYDVNTVSVKALSGSPCIIVSTKIETNDGPQKVVRCVQLDPSVKASEDLYDLSPILSFPDSNATEMTIYYVNGNKVFKRAFKLKPHAFLNLASYISTDLLPIKLSSFKDAEVWKLSDVTISPDGDVIGKDNVTIVQDDN